MQKTKVLYSIDRLIRGGSELQLIGLIEHLDKTQFEPYLLTIKDSDSSLVPDGCQHLAWDVPKLLSLRGVFSVLKLVLLLRRERVSVVQTYFQDATVISGLAAWLARVPVRIACFRDMAFWESKAKKKLMKCIYPLMTTFACNAWAVASHFQKLFSLPKEKFLVVPNGIDSSLFSIGPFSGQVENIGIVGNMTRQVKRMDLFVDAAAIVAKKYPQISWHLIGDGYLVEKLKEQANDLRVINNLHFVGRIDNVREYIKSMQIGVICSDSEGLSNAIIEYMFSGVATVATAVGGNVELIENGVTGLTTPAGDAEALARALMQLIENPNLRRDIIDKAYQQASIRFNWEESISMHRQLYLQKD
mgnify:CR=1 FL=1